LAADTAADGMDSATSGDLLRPLRIVDDLP